MQTLTTRPTFPPGRLTSVRPLPLSRSSTGRRRPARTFPRAFAPPPRLRPHPGDIAALPPTVSSRAANPAGSTFKSAGPSRWSGPQTRPRERPCLLKGAKWILAVEDQRCSSRKPCPAPPSSHHLPVVSKVPSSYTTPPHRLPAPPLWCSPVSLCAGQFSPGRPFQNFLCGSLPTSVTSS